VEIPAKVEADLPLGGSEGGVVAVTLLCG
jgi:hypothetical protein